MTHHDSTGTYCQLSKDELDAVVGGAKAGPPPAKLTPGKVYEIDDYSFDIEQVLG